MEMEDDEEMEVELVFEAREIDLQYEFDAATFFDFSREESFVEAREAEKWFDSAPSYPPSPFVTKLVMREEAEINVSPKGKGLAANRETLMGDDDDDDDMGRNHPRMDQVDNYNSNAECVGVYQGVLTNLEYGNLLKVSNQLLEIGKGLTFSNHAATAKPKAKMKSNSKSTFPRSSTLMKPTASQLAKQNRQPQGGGFRFQMPFGQREKSLCNSSIVESQAAKRQKLESGHLCKVGDAKQQTDFIHKAPKKDGTVDKGTAFGKLRLTVPREPDLETAHRAQRMRPKSGAEVEHSTVTVRRFKARPLNRKILEAPSLPLPKKSTPKLPEFQEFHLKTSERAMQHTSSVFSSSLRCNDSGMGLDKPCTVYEAENGKKESKSNPSLFRPSAIDTPKQDGYSTSHIFKARPLNKKIFSSKGEMGVFRNSKREATVPVEFNFQTDKRLHQNPPTDLFSKLSLKCEPRPMNASKLPLPRPSCVSTKGSKENRLNPLQTEHKATSSVNERLPLFGEKQSQCWSNGCMIDIGNQLNARSLGIL